MTRKNKSERCRPTYVKVTDLRTGITYPTIKEAAKALYVSRSHLAMVRRKGKNEVCGIPVSFFKTDKKTGVGNFKPVKCIETGEIFPSLKAAGQAYNITPSSIGECCRGHYQQSAGFHWRFV